MRIALPLVMLALIFCSAASLAVPIQISASTSLPRDTAGSSLFGSTDATVPLTVNFSFDTEDMVVVPAGTTIINSSGATSPFELTLLRDADLVDFEVVAGNRRWSAADTQTFGLGTTGLVYDLELIGNPSSGGVSGLAMTVNNNSSLPGQGFGTIAFGDFRCLASCAFSQETLWEDFETHVAGRTEAPLNIRVSAPVSVPEPDSVALLLAGIAMLVFCRIAFGVACPRRPS